MLGGGKLKEGRPASLGISVIKARDDEDLI